VAGAVHPRPMSPCTAPILVLNRSVVRSTGLPKRSRVSGIASSTPRPSRSCRSAKHPARSASNSTSITSYGSFSAPHVRMKLRSLASPRLLPRTPIPHDRIAMALFSAAQITSEPILDIDRRTGRTGGRAARGVSSWSLFCCLRFSVAAWRKEAPDGGDLGDFGLDARPRAHPAGQHGPCAEVRKAAGLTFSRLHFGGFAPRAWRVSVGCLEKNRGFFGIAPARLVLF